MINRGTTSILLTTSTSPRLFHPPPTPLLPPPSPTQLQCGSTCRSPPSWLPNAAPFPALHIQLRQTSPPVLAMPPPPLTSRPPTAQAISTPRTLIPRPPSSTLALPCCSESRNTGIFPYCFAEHLARRLPCGGDCDVP